MESIINSHINYLSKIDYLQENVDLGYICEMQSKILDFIGVTKEVLSQLDPFDYKELLIKVQRSVVLMDDYEFENLQSIIGEDMLSKESFCARYLSI